MKEKKEYYEFLKKTKEKLIGFKNQEKLVAKTKEKIFNCLNSEHLEIDYLKITEGLTMSKNDKENLLIEKGLDKKSIIQYIKNEEEYTCEERKKSYELWFELSRWSTSKEEMFEKISNSIKNGNVNLNFSNSFCRLSIPYFVLKNKGEESFLLLLKHGIDINQSNVYLENYLMQAVRLNYFNLVKILVSMGVDINARSRNGYTALMFAIENQSKEISLFLMENGADLFKKNNKGFTALDIANDIYITCENEIKNDVGKR